MGRVAFVINYPDCVPPGMITERVLNEMLKREFKGVEVSAAQVEEMFLVFKSDFHFRTQVQQDVDGVFQVIGKHGCGNGNDALLQTTPSKMELMDKLLELRGLVEILPQEKE